MVEHCPDWAKEIYHKNKLFSLYSFACVEYESDADDDCMIAQIISEWLELDQIDWEVIESDIGEYTCVPKSVKGIRFFGDEILKGEQNECLYGKRKSNKKLQKKKQKVIPRHNTIKSKWSGILGL